MKNDGEKIYTDRIKSKTKQRKISNCLNMACLTIALTYNLNSCNATKNQNYCYEGYCSKCKIVERDDGTSIKSCSQCVKSSPVYI